MDWAEGARAQTKAVLRVIVGRRGRRARIDRVHDTQGRPRVQWGCFRVSNSRALHR